MPKITKQTNKPPVRRSTRKLSVVERIQPLNVGEEGIKLNLYGRSGTGKTTFWSSFPGPILAIICSGGNKPGELRSINTPEMKKKVHQVILEAPNEVLELTEYCKENPDKFSTVVLDHASGLQDLVLKEVGELPEVPTQLSWGIVSQQQWGQVAIQVKTYLRSLLNLSQHVVIVAQEREFTPDEGTSLLMPYVASALSPSVVGWLNPACEYICQTFIRPKMIEKEFKVGKLTTKKLVPGKGVEYCLRTGPSGVFTTKFRMPKGFQLPEEIVDPDYKKLLAVIEAGSKL